MIVYRGVIEVSCKVLRRPSPSKFSEVQKGQCVLKHALFWYS